MVAGLAVLVAAASAGVVLAQSRENRAASTGAVARSASGEPSASKGQASRGALADESVGTLVRTGMPPWAGPVTQDEKQRERRRLSSDERNALRQDIRSASEEVYQPYRPHKP